MAAIGHRLEGRPVFERVTEHAGKGGVELHHPELILRPHPFDDTTRHGPGARTSFEDTLWAARSNMAAQRRAQSAAARNDRAGRLVVTEKLCEERAIVLELTH